MCTVSNVLDGKQVCLPLQFGKHLEQTTVTRAFIVLTASPKGEAPGFINGDVLIGLCVFAFTVILAFISVRALLKHGQQGNIRGASQVTAASLICAVPIALAASAMWFSIASGALDFFVHV